MQKVEPMGIKAMGHYTPGIISGGYVFVSGQLPLHPLTGKVVDGGVAEQVEQALLNMEQVLAEAGLCRDQVVRMHVYVSDIAYWDEANTAYAKFFGVHKPARTMVPTKNLHKGAMVEVEAIAELREGSIDG